MDIVRHLEYPLPVLKVLTDKIVIETFASEDGNILIDNIGGGELSGRITSNSPALKLESEHFSGNQADIKYSVHTEGCKPGDVIHSDLVVVSNGGEKIIPLIIKIIPSCIFTDENVKITTLKDFLAYAKKYPNEARRLFVSMEFFVWLKATGYEYMDIFDYFVKDPNKERALENFFILSKLKNRTVLSVTQNKLEISIGPEQKDIVTGVITVKKSGWGYVEAFVGVAEGEDWLSVSPSNLVSSGFSDEELAEVHYSVDTSKLIHKLTRGKIKIADSIEIELLVRKRNHLVVKTYRAGYEFEDSGVLAVTNNCGEDIMLDISTKESFVKFDGRRYFMGAYAEIPFTIKFTALQIAQIALKKQPFLENEISITTRVKDKTIKRTVSLTVGKYSGLT